MTDWLIVIDMQPAFGHPESPWYKPFYEPCARNVDALVQAFGDQAIFTRFEPPEAPTGSWKTYYDRWAFALDPANNWLWTLAPRWADRTSVASHRFSKWRELSALLPDDATLVMCGVATDCCVLGTVTEAVDDGRNLRLVTDSCAAATSNLHDAAVSVMADRAPMLALSSSDWELARR